MGSEMCIRDRDRIERWFLHPWVADLSRWQASCVDPIHEACTTLDSERQLVSPARYRQLTVRYATEIRELLRDRSRSVQMIGK